VTLPSWALKALSGAPPNSAFHTKGVLGTRHAPLSRALLVLSLERTVNLLFRAFHLVRRHLTKGKLAILRAKDAAYRERLHKHHVAVLRAETARSCRPNSLPLSKQLKHIRALARYHAAVPRQFVLADHSTRAEHTADDLRRATAHEGRWRLVESPGRIPRALSFSGAGGSTNAAKVISLRADRWRQSPALARATADPCLAWTAKVNKRVQFGFNYLIDIGIAAASLCHANVCRPDGDVGEREPLTARTLPAVRPTPPRAAS